MFWFFKKNKIEEKEVEKEKVTKKSVGKKISSKMTNAQVLQALNQMQKELDRLKLAVGGGAAAVPVSDADKIVEQALSEIQNRIETVQKSSSEKIIEGVFDGQGMVGADGARYDVPANYASKSKLVEGDILKLTINNMGAFVYKQIKPIERERIVGILDQDPQNLQFYAVAGGKKWKLITASVTYFKGEAGDEVVFLIPVEGGSKWAAVENIVKK